MALKKEVIEKTYLAVETLDQLCLHNTPNSFISSVLVPFSCNDS